MAVSPMLPKYARQMAEKHQLDFPLLLDPGNKLARRFGLVHVLPDYLRDIYARFGLDLPRFNGDNSWTLPLPARYIIATDGIIQNAEVGADYTVRPDPKNTIDYLKHAM